MKSQQLETITEQETQDGESTARLTEMLLEAPLEDAEANDDPLPLHSSQEVLETVRMLSAIPPEEIDLQQAWMVC